jgi:hypothetical protein
VKGKKKETTKEKLQSIKVKPVKGKKKETATKSLVPPGSKTKARHHRSVLEDVARLKVERKRPKDGRKK